MVSKRIAHTGFIALDLVEQHHQRAERPVARAGGAGIAHEARRVRQVFGLAVAQCQARKAGLPVGDDFGEFYRAVEWMGLQRHLKILGIFARLTLRDGKPKYLADTPRFMRYARATCSRYRPLGPLMVLLDEIEGNETRVGYTF